jgi:hypothetical protein
VIADHTIAVTFTQGSTTLINTGFDGDTWDDGWFAGGNPPWFGAIGVGVDGSNAAQSDIATDGAFTSNQISTASGKTIRVTFMYKVLNTNNDDDFVIAYSFVDNPNLYETRTNSQGTHHFNYVSPGIGNPALDGVWYTGSFTVTSQNYFSFRFESNLGENEQIWIDNVIITITS